MGTKKAKAKEAKRETLVYGNMEWFDVGEQAPSFAELPKAFKTAYDLWKKGKDKHLDEIASLLTPYVIAKFLPSNVSGWETLFDLPGAGDPPECEAVSVKVVGIDFSTKPIPLCKAEAIFRVPVTKAFTECQDFQSWQDENDYFHSGISFGWNVARTPVTEDLDFMWSNHSGCECMVEYEPESDEWPGVSALSGNQGAPAKPGMKKAPVREQSTASTDVDARRLTVTGLSNADRGALIEFLKDGWADEIRNMDDVAASTGDTVHLIASDQDARLIAGVLRRLQEREDLSADVTWHEESL